MNPPTTIKIATTAKLRIAYEVHGTGSPILVLHGWPDDARTWDKVVPGLVKSGYQAIVPWLRGYGPTTFVSESMPRTAAVVQLAQDAIDLLDELKIERATLLGHDWGGRAGYAMAALWPERIERLITLAVGYETGIKPGNLIEPAQAKAYWYQWFWQTERGQEMLERNRRGVCRFLWQTWSPHLQFTDAEFDRTAAAWDNPDWVAITLHAYRVRWGGAKPDPDYSKLEWQLKAHPPITIPTHALHGDEDGASLVQSSAGQEGSFTAGYVRTVLPGVGHFIQREAPEAVVDAVVNQVER